MRDQLLHQLYALIIPTQNADKKTILKAITGSITMQN